jgi:hypothetical protein
MNNGTFAESGTSKLEFDIADKDSVFVGVSRDVFNPTEIVGTIDNKPFKIEIPARSRFELQKLTLKSEEFARKTHESEGEKGGEVCVNIPNEDQDTAMVPGSYRFHYLQKDGNRAAFAPEDVIAAAAKETDRGACSFVSARLLTNFKSSLAVRGYADIQAFHAAPVQTDLFSASSVQQ